MRFAKIVNSGPPGSLHEGGSLRFRFKSNHSPGDIQRRVVLTTTLGSMSPGL